MHTILVPRVTSDVYISNVVSYMSHLHETELPGHIKCGDSRALKFVLESSTLTGTRMLAVIVLIYRVLSQTVQRWQGPESAQLDLELVFIHYLKGAHGARLYIDLLTPN